MQWWKGPGMMQPASAVPEALAFTESGFCGTADASAGTVKGGFRRSREQARVTRAERGKTQRRERWGGERVVFFVFLVAAYRYKSIDRRVDLGGPEHIQFREQHLLDRRPHVLPSHPRPQQGGQSKCQAHLFLFWADGRRRPPREAPNLMGLSRMSVGEMGPRGGRSTTTQAFSTCCLAVLLCWWIPLRVSRFARYRGVVGPLEGASCDSP